MGNENMRNRPENPAEDPLAELARLMGQEDEFAELMRQVPAAPRPAAQPAPRPAAPARRPAEEGRPAPGSFAALAAEVYGEGVPRSPARAGLEGAAREANRDMPRVERPADPRAPYVPPRPQSTEPARRPAPPRAEAPGVAPAAAARPAPPRADVPHPQPGRPEAPSAAARQEAARQEAARQELARHEAARQEAARQEALRREALRQEAVRQEAARREAASREAMRAQPAQPAAPAGPSDESRIPAWMARATAAARATGSPAAPVSTPAREGAPRPAQAFDLDEDAYDYGRSAAEYEPGPEVYEDYEGEEAAPVRRGRSRLLMVGGALAIFVAAAAVGYVFVSGRGGSGSTGEPPVIRADQGPNKVVPSQPTQQEQASDGQKLIYDRVGGSATTGNEQVVSSEEQPVDMSQAAQPQPRVIQPTPSGAPAQSNSAEPKRVRTLTVRADGSVVDDTSGASPLPPGAGLSAPSGAGNPVALNAGSGGPVPTDPVPLSSTPSIVDNMPSAPAPAAPPAPAPARVAAAPATASPAPAPAAATSAVPAGAYVVQIAAVRSEAEAQATWRNAQSKYGNLLTGQPFSVKRADLGDRGIYYRAQVGSFSSRDDAASLCEALRAQGGSCMIARN